MPLGTVDALIVVKAEVMRVFSPAALLVTNCKHIMFMLENHGTFSALYLSTIYSNILTQPRHRVLNDHCTILWVEQG